MVEKSLVLRAYEGAKSLALLFLAIFVSFVVAHFIWVLLEKVALNPGFGEFLKLLTRAYSRLWSELFGDPYFYYGVPVIVLLQQLIPIEERRRFWNVNTRIDFIYAIFSVIFVAICAPPLMSFLRSAYGDIFDFGVIFKWPEMPMWCKVFIGYLVIDFLGWFHHLLRHKVPLFWRFHAVHHSQKKMNIFSNQRFHPMDWIFSNIIKFVPAYIATNSLELILGYIAFHRFLDRLNHSNVKLNFGFLRYIFVTPQSHHVHHSSNPLHFDKNFGVSLSVWDHIFGTQYRNYSVYPTTGIPDDLFPGELDGSNLREIFKSFLRQLIYPFKRRLK